MNSQSQTIKVKPCNDKKEDFPKWTLKQEHSFIIADIGYVLDGTFLGKLPASKDMELDDSSDGHKMWAKYQRQNVKAMAAIMGAQESEDAILALQEDNELKLTWPSGTVLNMWKEPQNTF